MWISCNQSSTDKNHVSFGTGIFRFRISDCSLCTLQSNANGEAVSSESFIWREYVDDSSNPEDPPQEKKDL